MSILKSKKKVFFHFGYPKTATVFLQKNFFSKHDMINFFCRNHSKNDLIIFSVIDQIIELNNLDFSKKQNIFKAPLARHKERAGKVKKRGCGSSME